MMRTRESVVLAAFLLVGASCEGPAGDVGPTGAPGYTVTVAPAATSVEVGDDVEFSAATTPVPGDGETYTWASSDTSGATVASDGTVTGVAEGVVIIAATGDTSGATGVAALSVVPSTATEPISFADDVQPLFTTDNLWYVGARSCAAGGCHTGIGGSHNLDMGTYAGIMCGADADEGCGTEPIVVAGDWSESSLRGRLRNNRMPWGISVWTPRDGPEVGVVSEEHPEFGWGDLSADTNGIVKLIEAWIDAEAPNGDFDYSPSGGGTVTKNFADDVLPLFVTDNVWEANTASCNDAGCHTGEGGAHDLDMGTYAGIIAGADGGTEPIVVKGDADASSLRSRLRNNRMPWGMPTWVPRDGYNGEVGTVGLWVNQGALDN